MDIHWYSWISMDFNRIRMKSNGLRWFPLNSIEFKWLFLCNSIDFCWIRPNSIDVYRISLISTDFNWFALVVWCNAWVNMSRLGGLNQNLCLSPTSCQICLSTPTHGINMCFGFFRVRPGLHFRSFVVVLCLGRRWSTESARQACRARSVYPHRPMP